MVAIKGISRGNKSDERRKDLSWHNNYDACFFFLSGNEYQLLQQKKRGCTQDSNHFPASAESSLTCLSAQVSPSGYGTRGPCLVSPPGDPAVLPMCSIYPTTSSNALELGSCEYVCNVSAWYWNITSAIKLIFPLRNNNDANYLVSQSQIIVWMNLNP